MDYDKLRDILIEKRERGEFVGEPEHTMDFYDLEDRDVEFYTEWLDEDELESMED